MAYCFRIALIKFLGVVVVLAKFSIVFRLGLLAMVNALSYQQQPTTWRNGSRCRKHKLMLFFILTFSIDLLSMQRDSTRRRANDFVLSIKQQTATAMAFSRPFPVRASPARFASAFEIADKEKAVEFAREHILHVMIVSLMQSTAI